VGALAALGLQAWGLLTGLLSTDGHRLRSPSISNRHDGLAQGLLRPRVLAGAGFVLFLLGAFTIVPPGHQAIVERFGKPLDDIREPGLLLHLPAPIEHITSVDVGTIRRIPVAGVGSSLLTGDQSMLSMEGVLHYQVSAARDYTYQSADPEPTLRRLTQAALVHALARRSHEEALTSGRRALEEAVRERTQSASDELGLGVALVAFRLARVGVPAPVVPAFLDVISADEDRRTAINQAEALAAQIIPQALGEHVRITEEAQGEAVQLAAEANATAAHIGALARGGAASPSLTRHQARMDALEKNLEGRTLVIADPDIRVWWGESPLTPVDPDPGGVP
jgi:membrane protease subunit HflK